MTDLTPEDNMLGVSLPDPDTDTGSDDEDTDVTDADDFSMALLMPLSSFDLLEGKFRRAARVRTMNLIAAMLSLVVIVVLGSRFIGAKVQTSLANGDIEAAQQDKLDAERQIAEFQANGTATEDDVNSRIDAKLSALTESTGQNIDWALLLADIQSLGPGITVSSVTVSGAADKPVATPSTVLNKNGTSGETTTTVAEVPKPEVTLTGTAPTTSEIAELSKSLRDQKLLPYLTGSKAITSSCKEGSCSWTWVATLDEEKVNSRISAIEQATSRKDTTDTTAAAGQ